VGKPDGNRPLGTHRCMWEDNITMDLIEMGGGAGPVAGFCGCGNEPASYLLTSQEALLCGVSLFISEN